MSKIIVIFFFVFFCISQSILAQNISIDSLQRQIELLQKTHMIDSLKLENRMLRKSIQNADFNSDSLYGEISNMKTDLNSIQANLRLCHSKFKRGSLLSLVGLGAYLIGNFSLANNPTSPEGPLLIVAGFGGVITGIIITTSSHKYIGKAGASFQRFQRPKRTY